MKEILLKTPADRAQVPLLDAVQTAYLRSDRSVRTCGILFTDPADPYLRERDRSRPFPVVFQWESTGTEAAALFLSGTEDFSSSVRIEEKKLSFPEGSVYYGRIDVYNLIPGKEYFWKICMKNGLSSPVWRFRTEDHPPRLIAVPGLFNVRDIGGWKTAQGRIRYGRLYRGSAPDIFSPVSRETEQVLSGELKIRTEMDLRGDVPHAEIPGIRRFAFPAAAYGDWGAEGQGIFSEEQRGIVRDIFELLGREENYPVYCHCAGGSDRTGTLMFLLEGMLGVAEEDLYTDYELTTLSCLGERSRNNASFQGMLHILNGYAGNSLTEKILSFLGTCGIGPDQVRKIRTLLEDR